MVKLRRIVKCVLYVPPTHRIDIDTVGDEDAFDHFDLSRYNRYVRPQMMFNNDSNDLEQTQQLFSFLFHRKDALSEGGDREDR
jgi:hypothetical protein